MADQRRRRGSLRQPRIASGSPGEGGPGATVTASAQLPELDERALAALGTLVVPEIVVVKPWQRIRTRTISTSVLLSGSDARRRDERRQSWSV
jgi:hypothetical protein